MFFVRCDDRLVHGQVLFKWVDHEQIKEIIIVDDQTADDMIEKQMIQMTKPKNCQVIFLRSSQLDNIDIHVQEKKMILFKNIHLACLFVQENQLSELNLGRMASGIGKNKLLNNLFLTKEELEMIKETLSKGISIYSQMIPDEPKIELKKIVEETI